jgi:16S rRNA (cytidine1402-2'-O)-methyltransferase
MACVARELSKLHEEITTNTLEKLTEHYQNKDVKGEIVIVVAGQTKTDCS